MIRIHKSVRYIGLGLSLLTFLPCASGVSQIYQSSLPSIFSSADQVDNQGSNDPSRAPKSGTPSSNDGDLSVGFLSPSSSGRSVDNPPSGGPAANGLAPLSTDQILTVLQEQPEAIVELKSFVAEQAQMQGVSLQPDSISDEMLFNKISESPELRANISTFLRARGYVSSNEPIGSFFPGGGQFRRNDGSDLVGRDLELSGLPQSNSMSRGDFSSYRDYNSPSSLSQSARFPLSRDNTPGQRIDLPVQPSEESTVLHRPAPYNLLSMRDLYTQLSDQSIPLKRFGSEMFQHRDGSNRNPQTLSSRDLSLEVPAGPDYVVGPGDGLTINLWGGISQNLPRLVDPEGRIQLPEVGPLQVSGLTLDRVRVLITETLRPQFRDIQVAVTVSRIRSIRVYIVGDVQRPGAYEVSSLATSLNALYSAGGPTNTGSLRTLRHYRGKQLVGEIDLYEFLLHGVVTEDRLQAGDVLLVPPAGPQISVYGAVKRPAIYELKPGDVGHLATLASVLDDAGGMTVAAELEHIVVERLNADQHRETISVSLDGAVTSETRQAALTKFQVMDGDRIRISSVLPYSESIVYLDGHVLRPGRTPYREGMHLSDILHSYQDLLPEPADKGEIVRLVAPDMHPVTINFSVPDVLIGNENPALMPFDTVHVYGRYEADAPQVTIGGEVLRPGAYALSATMTAGELVRMAGGFKRDALLSTADLTSYSVVAGTKVLSERMSIRIGDAVLHADKSADIALKPGDVLTVHQITGWNDIGSSITLEGEVAHPGVYGIQQGERLSSILRRAGGVRDTSYPEGAVLLREEVRILEQKSRDELARQIETSATAARMRPNLGNNDSGATLAQIQQQQEEVLTKLKNAPVSGRLVIHISSDIASWENTPADIEVRSGDTLRVPKRPGFVLVSGQVYNTSAITFAPDKTADWYLRHAGGPTEIANRKDIFIIRANGSVIGRRSGHDVLSTRLNPGDVVVVPQKIIGASVFWKNLLTVGQLSSSIAITAAVAGLL